MVVLTAVLLALGAGGTAVTVYATSPERVRERNERDAGEGRPVTFVNKNGPPGWFKIQMGETVTRTKAGPSEPFTVVDHLATTVVEIEPDPHRTSYRFSAEVKRNDDGLQSEVGLCIGYSRHATSAGIHHYFALLSWTDSEDDRTRSLQVRLQHYGEDGLETFLDQRTDLGGSSLPPPGEGLEPSDWRRLIVDVGPEWFKFACDDCYFGHISRDQLPRFSRLMTLDSPDLAGFTPAFAPREGLCLYAHRCSASFRRVKLEPLPE